MAQRPKAKVKAKSKSRGDDVRASVIDLHARIADQDQFVQNLGESMRQELQEKCSELNTKLSDVDQSAQLKV